MQLFELFVEFSLIQPTIIYDYPTEVSPLSKQKPDDPDHVERFEFFAGGFELGNAFSELNDPVEQHKRFSSSWPSASAATTKPTRWTKTTSAPSPTACLPPAAKASASTAWSCCYRLQIHSRRNPVPANEKQRTGIRDQGSGNRNRAIVDWVPQVSILRPGIPQNYRPW